ncbi:MAG TPA: GNAT family N-acetyltransferase [Burkholderiales bacterium]|nr:GNAT family N-acetyltransferase [Burkholderiales bacterium]
MIVASAIAPVTGAPLSFANLLEPQRLALHLTHSPPDGFEPLIGPAGMLGFTTAFDLMTTADEAVKRWANRLLPSARLRRVLKLRAMFFGSTVTEYLPLPTSVEAHALPRSLLEHWNASTPLLIAKDVPHQSPLLSAADNQRSADFLKASEDAGFVILSGQALAYVPIDFRDEAEFLDRLSASRRKDLRRKLKARAALRIDRIPTGSSAFDDERFVLALYALYEQVFSQSEIHFDHLTVDFFRTVLRDRTLDGHLFVYYTSERLIGFNLCFVRHGKLIDKTIGLRYPEAKTYNLYFVSWMHNLAFAREHGLTHYVAGWTDPQIKAYLGARFTFTRHAVYFRNPLLRAAVRRFGSWFESDRDWYQSRS